MHIALLSVHGLLRGHTLELGRDADTGGQLGYVLDLSRALSKLPQVQRVSLITRLVDDDGISPDYRQALEPITDKAHIVRLPFGPKRYIRKELLWPYLDELVDRSLAWLRQQDKLPDVIHSHYADAGYVGRELSLLLGVPLIHTAHSLGREKRARLLAAGRKDTAIDKQFHFERRITAEESVLEHASLVITSTHQEISQPYARYQNFLPHRARVIAPGVDLERFAPPSAPMSGWDPAQSQLVKNLLGRFLLEPRKPMVLALCRPDTRKNISALVAAYAQSDSLQQLANLVIIAGTRGDIRAADQDAQQFFTELLLDIDRYDLYGRVAIPKQHSAQQVPLIYQLAVRTRGVLVNPGLNENFGLTLLEAAASGLPVIATVQGGPQEIVSLCRNGLLIDPQDTSSLTQALLTVLGDRARWRRWSKNGMAGVARHYTWDAHALKYLKLINTVRHKARKQTRLPAMAAYRAPAEGPVPAQPLARAQRLLMTDLDNTLIGDESSMHRLMAWLESQRPQVAFGIATGRTLESTLKLLNSHQLPMPHVLVTSVGSAITYGSTLQSDTRWTQHIRHAWRRDELIQALQSVPGLSMQPESHQSLYKISFNLDEVKLPALRTMQQVLRQAGLRANMIISHGRFLDVLPVHASKGRAIRYLAYRWGFDLNQLLVAGDSGNDWDMLVGDTLAVVVGGYSAELSPLEGRDRVFFAPASHAQGILQGIDHYGFDRSLADQLRPERSPEGLESGQ